MKENNHAKLPCHQQKAVSGKGGGWGQIEDEGWLETGYDSTNLCEVISETLDGSHIKGLLG